MGEEWAMGGGGPRGEIILLTRPAPGRSAPDPVGTLREVLSSTVGMAAYTASTLASLIEQTVAYAVASTVNSALDRLVPAIADAVIDRIDLTGVVLERVDINRIVMSALDGLDLTQIVIDRVDIDAIVKEADIEAVIDRVPIIPLANYVVDEVDLPQIIRDSTNGIAGDAMNAMRRQGIGADQLVQRIVDRLTLRRGRDVTAPGVPESLAAPSDDDDHDSGKAQPDPPRAGASSSTSGLG